MGEISSRVVDGPFGTQLKVEDYREEGIPVIRVSNVRTGDIDEKDLVRISSEKHQQIIRSRVLPGDVILTKAGAILGYSAVFPEHLVEGNITSHSVAITCKPVIDPYYLKYVFQSQIGQLQIYRWGNKSTRPELNTGEVTKILVPLPDLEIQRQIVSCMDDAIKQKRRQERKARNILASIDDYLLGELGISLPPEPPNTVEHRQFYITHSGLSSSRYDPFYFQPLYQRFYNAITGAKYHTWHLNDIISDIVNGVEMRKYSKRGKRYLRVTDLTSQGISDHNVKYVRAREIPERVKLTKQDFLISRSGSLGLVSIVTDQILGSILSSHIFRVRLKTDQVLPEYLQAYLRSSLGQFQFFQRNNGGVVPEITQGALKSIVVVIPPIEIQQEIAEHIRGIYQQAALLRQEAESILVQAKAQVEQMILGA